MYAVIKSGGKQYKVAPGGVVRVEKLNLEKGSKVEFDAVLAVNNDQQTTLGDPVVQNAKVIGTVVESGKAKKVIIFKYKRKKQYRVKRGHRQPYTAVQIDEINLH
jgi:large subunit ribosomal protein L21